jgi:hypothetical protein
MDRSLFFEEIIMQYKATIIGVADATHYLVGATDANDSFIELPQLGEVAMCNSLSAAKALLREHNFHIAQLTLQTAYDEMCGLPTSAETQQTIYL